MIGLYDPIKGPAKITPVLPTLEQAVETLLHRIEVGYQLWDIQQAAHVVRQVQKQRKEPSP